MRRVVTTHVRTRDRWQSRVNVRSDVSSDISRGLDAYAHRQADIYWSLAVSFINIWSPELKKNNIIVNWPSELAEQAATAEAIPERKSGRKKANAYITDSESGDDAEMESRFGGSRHEGDTESLVNDEEFAESDGESVLHHLAGYADSENSEDDTQDAL
jgi:hypothetical protein